MCINRTPANVQKRLAAWSNHGPIPRDSGTGGTIEQWQSQPSARARSALVASSRRCSVSYARREQYRRLSHAGKAALGSVGAALLGLVIASAGAALLAGLLLLTAFGLALYARFRSVAAASGLAQR